jgi:hypothetical protein
MEWKKVIGKLNNFYVIFAVAFLVWMSFFDSTKVPIRYHILPKMAQVCSRFL